MEKVLNLFKHQTHFCVLTSSFSLIVCFLNYALNLNAFCHQAHFSRHQSNSNLMIMMLSSNLFASFKITGLHSIWLLWCQFTSNTFVSKLCIWMSYRPSPKLHHEFIGIFGWTFLWWQHFFLIASSLNMFLNLNAFCHQAYFSRQHSKSSLMMVSSVFQHISIQFIWLLWCKFTSNILCQSFDCEND